MITDHQDLLSKECTVLVNSCDSYLDLWEPFFQLLKKYFPSDIPIVLNTESKDFLYEGLNILCVHPKVNSKMPYGARLLNALDHVKTPFVILMLDDFFLRSCVSQSKLEEILKWMKQDPQIVCFSSELSDVYVDWEIDHYPGFRRVPPGNDYILNMQGAIWRTDSLRKYWRPNVSPWEWEEYCSAMTVRFPRDKFYCIQDLDMAFLDYGHYRKGDIWGVVRGKWVLEDVVPFFNKEGIHIDYSVRGGYSPDSKECNIASAMERYFSRVVRCLGWGETLSYLQFVVCLVFSRIVGKNMDDDFFKWRCQLARNRFLNNKHKSILEGE